MQRKNSPQYVINSYQKKSKVGPIILWAIAGIIFGAGIVLLVLWETDGVSVRELGQRLYLDSGTLTPLLKKMEEAGFVTRERSTEDGRVVLVHLTEKGKALRHDAEQIPLRLGGCLPLTTEEAKLLHSLLHRLLEADTTM